MLEFLSIIQIIISALLIGAILLQARGSGLSSVFGGESTFYHTRRGMEKIIFWATIILAILFVITGIASFLF
ncbi:preprotein translocase subunit SecG [Candidatus Azambacteria bacterium RIFCSPHIGHO2_01_FULL_40_24]|uniref:Protein-export membrane protein SecG n=1 Tax=Candidatus Azambacteria bacterium RIFCSPHIGHO2_01_FULL_40_24 TaxID=1797301 RepID=A0A1F5B4W9_9BACT|nr:MAG: preprotein translocase subunit SecG [Candidatus Azambacteria bacterium RIFCSPHIGHO2_01_FULL_40_24]